MNIALQRVLQFLQAIGPFDWRAAPPPWWWLSLMVMAFAPLYGAVMGTYYFVSAERLLQVMFSAVKLPLLLFATTALCLPGFVVLNTIAGLRDDFDAALRAIFAGQAGLSIVLASLAPLTRMWYFSEESYRGALLFNAAMFTIATLAGHLITFRYYRPLIAHNSAHRWLAYSWVVLYAFVGIQMGWMLRPFVGDPDMPVTFFRAEPFSNAYVVVARLIFGNS